MSDGMRGSEGVGVEASKEIKEDRGKKKASYNWAGDRLSGGKEKCGSMWKMSITLMNYLRLEIPRPSGGLSAALWSERGWGGWMEGAMSALYPILHPCHRSPNPQRCAADGGLIGGPFRKRAIFGTARCLHMSREAIYIVCVWECTE